MGRTGTNSLQVFTDHRKGAEHGKTFESQQNFAPGPLADPCYYIKVFPQNAKIAHIGGTRKFRGIKGWKIRIEDDCEHMASLFRSRYSDPDLILAKSLMIYDPRIPDRPMQLERQDQALEFMRSILPGLMTVY